MSMPKTGLPLSESSLLIAALLTTSGGFLDAFTYIGHGHVFANAMSGNIVLLGVSIATGDWIQATRHVPPIVAFVVGVFLAHCMRLPRFRHYFPHPAHTCLALEIIILSIGSCLPDSFPSVWLVPIIALVAAMQNSSFTHLESQPYNSVMTTGNLRKSIEALFRGTLGNANSAALREARLFGTICFCFLLGAAIGALFTTYWQNVALIIPVIMLGLVFFLLWPRQMVDTSEQP